MCTDLLRFKYFLIKLQLLDQTIYLGLAHRAAHDEALRIEPVVQLGITDHFWTIGEPVHAALDLSLPDQPDRRIGWFTAVDGEKHYA
jgi:hypothetical protein